ncbi:MAG: DinB family protein [Saprospiraceae bacterium]|nr:DinB family protein [Saprospiraceae bacterium]
MKIDIKALIHRLEQVSQAVKKEFSDINAVQLNWKENPDTWSIGECLEHLMITNKLYFKQFDQVLNHQQKTFWERLPFLANFFGGMLLKSLTPKPTHKIKAPSIFKPSQSKVSIQIVQDFIQHNQKVIEYFQQLQLKNPQTIITSPAASFVTLRLGTAMQILTNHEERHLFQAQQIKENYTH